MSYWDDINKNTVDSAHGACPTMFINTARVYTSNKDGKEYIQYTNSLITIIPATNSDIVSLVAIPLSSAPVSPDNSYVAYMNIGIIGTGRTYTVYEQELFHSTEPGKEDEKRASRKQYTFDRRINYNGVNYSIAPSVILPYSSSGELFRNGFAYTYWGNQALTISTKYNGRFRHIAHDVNPASYSVYWSSLPIFDDTIADENKKGELIYNILYNDWGTELQENPKNTSTKWNLYIDGTKNPLYKLTWDCADIPSSDTSRVKVIYCDFVESVNTFVALSTNYYNYNAKSVKLNYHDIHEAIWDDNDGPIKSAVYIIVQFEYFETTTVIPKDTSAYMYCELFPNETNGHMFGYIGFCEKGEKPSTFIKTDSGDGSTFTAHDGTDGSDGYTKDDDKGYDDNKDKDDDDDECHDELDKDNDDNKEIMSFEEAMSKISNLTAENEKLKKDNEAYMAKFESMSDYDELKAFKLAAEEKEKQEANMVKMCEVLDEISEKGVEMSEDERNAYIAKFSEYDSVAAWSNMVKAAEFDRVGAPSGNIHKIGLPYGEKKKYTGSIWDN